MFGFDVFGSCLSGDSGSFDSVSCDAVAMLCRLQNHVGVCRNHLLRSLHFCCLWQFISHPSAPHVSGLVPILMVFWHWSHFWGPGLLSTSPASLSRSREWKAGLTLSGGQKTVLLGGRPDACGCFLGRSQWSGRLRSQDNVLGFQHPHEKGSSIDVVQLLLLCSLMLSHSSLHAPLTSCHPICSHSV